LIQHGKKSIAKLAVDTGVTDTHVGREIHDFVFKVIGCLFFRLNQKLFLKWMNSRPRPRVQEIGLPRGQELLG
jgi:hypothetical protein